MQEWHLKSEEDEMKGSLQELSGPLDTLSMQTIVYYGQNDRWRKVEYMRHNLETEWLKVASMSLAVV